jgi:hypothetical protein
MTQQVFNGKVNKCWMVLIIICTLKEGLMYENRIAKGERVGN